MSKIKVFTDGGSRGNPGEAAYGVVISDENSELIRYGKTLGIATNNEAEYTAVLSAVEWIKENLNTIERIDFFMDSLLVCQQLKGIWKIKKPHLRLINEKIKLELKKLNVPYSLTHVPREMNKIADLMVNHALDNKLKTS